MKHDAKRLWSLLLALVLVLSLLPTTALAEGYTELGTVDLVRGSWSGKAPMLGGKCTDAKGYFEVTEPTGKNVELTMAAWHKKSGSEWKIYYGPNFEEGTYRLHVQLRTDSFGDKTYYRLTNNVRLFINGSEWTMEGKLHDCYSSSGYATVYFYGPEYTLTIPAGSHSVTVLNDGHGSAWADAVYSRPGYPVQLSAKADERYRFDHWEVVSGGVTISHGKFTMGNENVVVKAHFVPDGSLDLGSISQVQATAKKPFPLLGGANTKPQFTVTDPTGKNVEITMGMWQKKSGSTWEAYHGSSFEAGTYRYHTQLRTDSFDDGSYYRLTEDTTLLVNGEEWSKDGKMTDAYASSGYGIIFFNSPEYEAVPPADYTVTFDPCSGSVTPTSMRTDKYGMLESLPTPVRDGFTFTGWYTERTYGNRVAAWNRFIADTTLYAHWYEDYHGIVISGGKADRSAAPSGATVTITADPRENCTFSKWTVDAGGVTLADPNSATTTFVMGHENVRISASFTYDGETIDTVYLNVEEPKAGMTPPAAVAESEQYRASTTRWFDVETGNQLTETDTFRAGKQYLLRVYLNTTVPFQTAGITGYVNGTTHGVNASPMGFAMAQVEKVFTALGPMPFEDVLESDYFYKPVLWAIYHNPAITAGVDATHFGPHNNCTREQIVTFLWAANGKPDPEGTGSGFSDVAPGAWYYKPVMWAVENKVTSGFSDGSFGVGQPCTRAQAMTFLWAAQGKPAPSSMESPFGDVSSGDWFCKAILWAYENGITKGVGNGLFGVNNTCTRAQIITFLYKAFK